MKQRLVLAFLSFVGVVNAMASVADSSAIPDEAMQMHLQEVQVISRQTEIHSQAYRLVTEISREAIAALPATTVADLLQTLPGLDIRTRGANGAQADVSMRGGTFDQVMIMLNGACVSDAQTGHYAMNIPIPLSAIERIDVLEGAAASIAGGNAFCGAINIVTQHPEKDTYHVGMQMGMNRFAKAELTGGWRRNEWCVLASADYAHSNGYYAPDPTEKEATALRNSDFNGANVYLNATWRGLDNNWCLCDADAPKELRHAATLEADGRTMECWTTMKGLQVYTGNYIERNEGKSGTVNDIRHAVCLEAQQWPDSIHHDKFPNVVLRPGEKLDEITEYRFL